MDEQSLKDIELELAILIRHITSISSDKRVGTLDRSAYLLLQRLFTHGSAGVKALADEFHLDISTVSRQAAALEQKGYVYKIPDPVDGRAFSFQITELGAKELAEHRQARLNRMKYLLRDWTEEECQRFGQLLYKFNKLASEVSFLSEAGGR
ncbi:MarR family winged helix-turn-helix transcriptional regulator [Brevibacillus sp. B_LB10_24]|uniref:MarR family winged helix-turn-helix transcriptional regulator n=1 Tax=Brevibacillus sp. B_LB10_24 TaxID=3380645 RepID=UPI0038BC04CA